jgi:hypothetical protein
MTETILSILDDDDRSLAEDHQDLDLLTEETPSATDDLITPRPLRVEAPNSLFETLRISIHQTLGMDWNKKEVRDHHETELYDTAELQEMFSEFRRREAELSDWNPAYLVSPSGSPSQPLHVKLNYPTFKTKNLEYGETADDTNPCMNLLMRKGLAASNAFWYEANFRRQTPTKSRHQEVDTKLWSMEIKDAHSEFSRLCETRGKKVLLLLGAPNRKDFNQRYDVAETAVKVSETVLVNVGIVRRPDGTTDFLVVYCPHPEWLFWNWTIWAGKYYDACINVAAALSGVEVIPHYFEERAKRVKAAPTQKNALRDSDTTRKLEKQNQVRCHPDDLPETVRTFANEHDVSREKLLGHFEAGWSVAQMIYSFVRSREPTKSSWNVGVRMPRNLPRNLPAQELRSTPAISAGSSRTLSGSHVAARTPMNVRIIPNVTKSKNPIVKTAEIHLGREIRLMCIRCGVTPHNKPIDKRPAFVTISDARGKYIAQRQGCATPACNPKRRKGQIDQFMVPQDPNVPFIRSDNLCKIGVPKGTKKV